MLRRPASLDVLLTTASVAALYQCCELIYLRLPGIRVLPNVLWIIGLVVAFLCFGAIAVLVQWYWRRRSNSPSLLALMQRRRILMRALILVVVAVCITVLIVSATTPDLPQALRVGQPVAQGGHYFLSNHGSLTQISRFEYLQALRANQQSNIALTVVFYLISLVAVGVAGKRAGRRSADGRQVE